MNNEIMVAKAKRQLEGALSMLNSEINAKNCDEAATLALIAARLLCRVAGRIDNPRPVVVEPPKRKPRPSVVRELPKTEKEIKKSARVGMTIIDVSGNDSEPKPRVKKDGIKSKRPSRR